MGKLVKTKFKGSYTGGGTEVFGVLDAAIKYDTTYILANNRPSVGDNEAFVKVISGGYLYEYNTPDVHYEEVSYTGVPNKAYNIKVTDAVNGAAIQYSKYYMQAFYNSDENFNFSKLKYTSGISSIIANGIFTEDDMANIAANNNVTVLTRYADATAFAETDLSRISGPVAALKHLKSLTVLRTRLEFESLGEITIEDVFDYWASEGKTGTMSFWYPMKEITSEKFSGYTAAVFFGNIVFANGDWTPTW